jgi:citronellyl-CoA dehydrogenase
MQNFQSERLIGSSSAIAGAFYALERSLDWGRERSVFNKPLIKHQYWQYKLADLYAKCEASKALVYKSADRFNTERYVNHDAISYETVKLIAMSKLVVGDAAWATSKSSGSLATTVTNVSSASAAERVK